VRKSERVCWLSHLGQEHFTQKTASGKNYWPAEIFLGELGTPFAESRATCSRSQDREAYGWGRLISAFESLTSAKPLEQSSRDAKDQE
jgi:hypothetical protein